MSHQIENSKRKIVYHRAIPGELHSIAASILTLSYWCRTLKLTNWQGFCFSDQHTQLTSLIWHVDESSEPEQMLHAIGALKSLVSLDLKNIKPNSSFKWSQGSLPQLEEMKLVNCCNIQLLYTLELPCLKRLHVDDAAEEEETTETGADDKKKVKRETSGHKDTQLWQDMLGVVKAKLYELPLLEHVSGTSEVFMTLKMQALLTLTRAKSSNSA